MFENFIVSFMCLRLFHKNDGVWRRSSHLIFSLNLLYFRKHVCVCINKPLKYEFEYTTQKWVVRFKRTLFEAIYRLIAPITQCNTIPKCTDRQQWFGYGYRLDTDFSGGSIKRIKRLRKPTIQYRKRNDSFLTKCMCERHNCTHFLNDEKKIDIEFLL